MVSESARLARGVDAQQPVGAALDPPEDGSQEGAFVVEHARQVDADRFDQRHQDDDEDRDLCVALEHQRFSPRSSA